MSDQKPMPSIATAKFNRRNVLIGSAGSAGLGVLGIGGSILFNTPARLIEGIVRARLPGLEVAEEDMARFVADFLATDSDTSKTEWIALRLLGPYANLPPFRWMAPRFVSQRLQNYERRVLNEFMMGSNFFETYAVGNPMVTYTGIYSVYEAPCVNPLPRFPDEPDMV